MFEFVKILLRFVRSYFYASESARTAIRDAGQNTAAFWPRAKRQATRRRAVRRANISFMFAYYDAIRKILQHCFQKIYVYIFKSHLLLIFRLV